MKSIVIRAFAVIAVSVLWISFLAANAESGEPSFDRARFVLQNFPDGKFIFDGQNGNLYKLTIVPAKVVSVERFEWVLVTRPFFPRP